MSVGLPGKIDTNGLRLHHRGDSIGDHLADAVSGYAFTVHVSPEEIVMDPTWDPTSDRWIDHHLRDNVRGSVASRRAFLVEVTREFRMLVARRLAAWLFLTALTVIVVILLEASMLALFEPPPSYRERVLKAALAFLLFLVSLAPLFIPETRRILQVFGVLWAIVGCVYFVVQFLAL